MPLESTLAISMKIKIAFGFDIAILLLEIYSTEKIAHVHRGIYKDITTALFVVTMIE